MSEAILAGGCFWCLEAVFQRLRGVDQVVSGYTGGQVEAPSYREVCSEDTGHAEAVRITFDPESITFRELLEVFFAVHDPTTRDRQGPDVGTQYRSAIYYRSEGQRETARQVIQELEEGGLYDAPIVTELEAAGEFYPAEEEHQDYYRRHPERMYCRAVISPKIRKLRDGFREKLRERS